ncbi:WXG100 family type VII secretion target [Micromonospora coxensis]|uniref:WXG100 family type VII secretion target n=1 Tax=Micromonospora coxensis TaxID=356852 RepID=UPI003447EDA7
MSFSVEPDALKRAAARLNDASLDAQAAKAYMLKHTEMSWDSQGLLNKAWQSHAHLVDEMTKRLTHLVELLGKSRDALEGTADYYRRTDTRSAARLDARYPTVDRSGYEMPGGRPLSGNMP